MRVLSLFDGMSCGMLAFQKCGIKIDEYIAYEIDKYAVKTSKHNFPNIKHMGDVFEADFSNYYGFDFIVGGSPCTYWSIAQSKDKRETIASGFGWDLFSQYVRALKEANPKYFIYENNKSMSKQIRESISEAFGFEPICINSALVSAQSRQRLYWVGKRNDNGTYDKVDISLPIDKGILLKDVIEDAITINTINGKAHTLTASYYKIGENPFSSYNSERGRQRVAVPICVNSQSGNSTIPTRKQPSLSERIYSIDGKNPVLTSGYHTNIAVPVETTTNENSDTDLNAPIHINTFNNKDEKNRTIMSGYYKYGETTLIRNKGFKGGATAVAEPVGAAQRGRYVDGNKTEQHIEVRPDGKSNCLTTVQKDSLVCAPVRVGQYGKGGQGQRIYSVRGKSVTLSANGGGQGAKTGLYKIDLPNGDYTIRKLTIEECKRLQTVPEWYEFPVSNTQAYKMLGNGWTVDVIVHIIKSILGEE